MRKTKYHKSPKNRGQILSNARVEQGLTLKQMEKLVGVKESYISRIERNKQKPSIQVMAKIFKVLQCSEDVLLDWVLEDTEQILSKALNIRISLVYTLGNKKA